MYYYYYYILLSGYGVEGVVILAVQHGVMEVLPHKSPIVPFINLL